MGLITLNDRSFERYISYEEIHEAVKKMAVQINADYKHKHPVFLSVLNGSFMFTAELLKEMDIVCEVSFIKLASYQGMQSTGNVRTLIGLDNDISNTDVIILEDIVDSGNTLDKLISEISALTPKSIKVASLLFKPDAYTKTHPIDYIGLEIPNDFIVGFGLDYNGLGRNLKSIYKVINQ
jgi:hypoxanthine phosphoribosyltransferase